MPRAGWAVGEHGQGGDGRGQLAHVVQVEVYAGQRAGAGHGQHVLGQFDRRTHQREDPADRVTRLGGGGRPVGDPHRSTGDRSRGQERGRVGQIRLDGPVPWRNRARLHPPGVGAAVVDGDAHRSQHLHRHFDVRHRGHRLSNLSI